MSALFKRNSAVIPMTPNEDQRTRQGYAVKVSSGAAALVTAATDIPIGVVLDGENTDGKSAIGVCDCLAGTVLVKLDATPGTVTTGTYLVITAAGAFKADPGTGSRVQCARALETGTANELIEAVLFKPTALS